MSAAALRLLNGFTGLRLKVWARRRSRGKAGSIPSGPSTPLPALKKFSKGSKRSRMISAKHQKTLLFSCILLSAEAYMSLPFARCEFGEQSASTTPSENLAINTVNWSVCVAPELPKLKSFEIFRAWMLGPSIQRRLWQPLHPRWASLPKHRRLQ